MRNLVRAVTKPFPGAFSFIGERKCFFWEAREIGFEAGKHLPGTVISVKPLTIAAGQNAIVVNYGQAEGSIYMAGEQLAMELSLVPGMRFGASTRERVEEKRKKKVLILGVNGFIGSALSERLLESGKYEVHGMDLYSNYCKRLLGKPGFYFQKEIFPSTANGLSTIFENAMSSSPSLPLLPPLSMSEILSKCLRAGF